MRYDIAIIGGGPAGYSAALKAAKMNAKVILFESDKIGGTCLNVGCIPTKYYVAQAELIQKIKENTYRGIYKEAGLFSFKKIYNEKQKVTKKLTGGIRGLIQKAGVTFVEAEAQCKDPNTILADGKQYAADRIILCMGTRNFLPSIEGGGGKHIYDSTGILSLDKLPRSIVIIGAGVIGLEMACVLNAFGTKVTAVDVLPEIIPSEERDSANVIFNQLKKDGISFKLGSKVVKILDENDQKCVVVESGGVKEKLYTQCVLVAVGRSPNNELAKQLGVKLDTKGFISVDRHMQTSVPNIYAAGDIIGGYLLAHSAYQEAETAVLNCLGQDVEMNPENTPRCIFVMPQFAAVGLTEDKAKDKYTVATGKFPFAASGKAIAIGEENGFVKAVADKKTGRLLGCTIVGPGAAELISAAVVAINKKTTVKEFEKMIFPHPTLGECIKEAVLDIEGQALHY